jgi:aspartokinase
MAAIRGNARRIVSKFGGSSVGDANAMRSTSRLLMSQGLRPDMQPIGVASACFGTTDRLVEAVHCAAKGDTKGVIRARRK